MRKILTYHKNNQFPAYKSTDKIDNELILTTKNSFNERYCLFDINNSKRRTMCFSADWQLKLMSENYGWLNKDFLKKDLL